MAKQMMRTSKPLEPKMSRTSKPLNKPPVQKGMSRTSKPLTKAGGAATSSITTNASRGLTKTTTRKKV